MERHIKGRGGIKRGFWKDLDYKELEKEPEASGEASGRLLTKLQIKTDREKEEEAFRKDSARFILENPEGKPILFTRIATKL